MAKTLAKTARSPKPPKNSEKKAVAPPIKEKRINLPKDPVTGRVIKLPTSGRKPGQPNHITKDMRAAVWKAFETKGGVDYLLKLADEQPKVFGHMLAKLMPAEVLATITTDLATRLAEAKAFALAQKGAK